PHLPSHPFPTRRSSDLTLRIPIDPKQAIEILRSGMVRRLDAGCVTYQSADGATGVRHFINIADAGLGGEVVHIVGNGTKRFGSADRKSTRLNSSHVAIS